MNFGFENGNDNNIIKTSEKNDKYNCISWSLKIKNKRIWPNNDKEWDWPPELPLNDTLDNFIDFYKLNGFEDSNDFSYEKDYYKIAIML